ncbi:hypothetical protein LTR62_001490 [Meristemomyces frigidus]|uniref:Exonuclease domain-containing protein n=1 Tax=Meristemomyces frigidus TaxID=1508187 RepID=A0AAN7TNF1_9PEZI|nr:hypothetical protein LTR62_001490 [Meristemomyces frigidus]
MVFSTTTLFKGIPCPQPDACGLTNCIFSHEPVPEKPQRSADVPPASAQLTNSSHASEPPSKRQRVTYERAADKPPSKADLIRSQLSHERQFSKIAPSASGKPATPASLSRAVSPPLKTNGKALQAANNPRIIDPAGPPPSVAIAKPAALNPRLIPNDPVGHAKRSIFVKHIHGEMVRLNRQLVDCKSPPRDAALTLVENDLVRLALDEEEKLALASGNVYANVIKNRIAAFRKMTLDDWIAHLKSTDLFGKKEDTANKPIVDAPFVIETGLTPAEEVAVLPHLIIKNQTLLAKEGYIPTPPTPEQAAEAAAAVEASKNYEICDRCTSRFQVFPNRSEEGLLTSNGSCKFHPNRKIFPQRTKADTGPKEPYYPCCSQTVGSEGCTVFDHHVFKVSSPARLAAVMPFIVTPSNEDPAKDAHAEPVKAVAFDCEMGYTTLGMEMIRITAVSWPAGEDLFDVLVRPLGIVLDLNSRFSGVWPEDMANATPYQKDPSVPAPPPPTATSDSTTKKSIQIIPSPHQARNLLCSFLTPFTPLLGHAIDNDLNVVRLCHPTIIDTILLYPHPRGLPMRYGLKMLSAKFLRRAIQQGGERGHDSREDSVATGELVRVKVRDKWAVLRATGWKFDGGLLVSPKAQGGLEAGTELSEDALSSAAARKRKKRDSGEGGSLLSFLQKEGQMINHEDGKGQDT